jgi:hypothetical protein
MTGDQSCPAFTPRHHAAIGRHKHMLRLMQQVHIPVDSVKPSASTLLLLQPLPQKRLSQGRHGQIHRIVKHDDCAETQCLR